MYNIKYCDYICDSFIYRLAMKFLEFYKERKPELPTLREQYLRLMYAGK